ncbi:hypothetical protein T061_17110 [Salmonella enterica subsp. arizonae]|nr:hypothetical protein [Salmonella enterica subsp. arizonae]
MHNDTYPDCKDAVIEMLIGLLVDVSAIAEVVHDHASRESEHAGSLVLYSLAVIQNSADQALRDISNIMLSDIADSGIIQGVRHE